MLGPDWGRRSGSGPQLGQSLPVRGDSVSARWTSLRCPLRVRPLPLGAKVQGSPLPDAGEAEWAQQDGPPPQPPHLGCGEARPPRVSCRPRTGGTSIWSLESRVGDPWARLRVPTSLLPPRARPDLGRGCGCWEEPTALQGPVSTVGRDHVPWCWTPSQTGRRGWQEGERQRPCRAGHLVTQAEAPSWQCPEAPTGLAARAQAGRRVSALSVGSCGQEARLPRASSGFWGRKGASSGAGGPGAAPGLPSAPRAQAEGSPAPPQLLHRAGGRGHRSERYNRSVFRFHYNV